MSTSAAAFLREFEAKEIDTNESFFQLSCLDQYFENRKPTPSKLSYDQIKLNEIRDIILNNFYCRIGNMCDTVDLIQFLHPVYDLFKESDTTSKDLLTKHILLLHYSKTNFPVLDGDKMIKEQMYLIVPYFESVEPVQEFETLFEKMITNRSVTSMIDQVVLEVTNQTNSYDLAKTKLDWFKNPAPSGDFEGFSGLDTVYFNKYCFMKTERNCLESDAKKNRSSDASQSSHTIIHKLKFITVVMHELAHIALRKTTNNLNESKEAELEIGCMVERRLLGGKLVDWRSSTQSLEVDTLYCARFVSEILSGDLDTLPVSIEFFSVIQLLINRLI